MPIAFALEPHDGDEIAVEFAAPEGRLDLFLANERSAPALDTCALGRHRASLDHRAAELAVEHAEPAVGWKGSVTGAQHGRIEDFAAGASRNFARRRQDTGSFA